MEPQPVSEEEFRLRLALHFLPGIGPVLARTLISYCGSIDAIFKRKAGQLEKIPGIGRERAKIICGREHFEKAEAEIAFIKKNRIQSAFCFDDNYPSRLKNCYDAPLMVFSKGTVSLNMERMIAIVGTRFITPYGRECIEKIVGDFAMYKPVIVSGLAFGADVHAHKAALKNGLPTIGVVAHGLDRLYPSEHLTTANKMVRNGAILTEYPSGTKPDRENFPARNRIVAGMCDAVIIIESAEKGGALITAELANDYNRDVFALPGRVTDHYSRGCNNLIMQNKAMLFETAGQVAEVMQWTEEKEGSAKKRKQQLELFESLNESEKKLIEILSREGTLAIDALAIKAAMSVSSVSALLLNLEFSGMLRALPGKQFELIQS